MALRKNGPLREVIFRTLVDDIIHGRINSGEKLLESELAKKFKVSRTPVREALHMLEKEEYVTHRVNAGVTVKKITARNVREMFDVVGVLEGYATEVTSLKGTNEAESRRLESLVEGMEQAALQKNFEKYEEINLKFHRFFLDICGNRTLTQIAANLRRKVYMLASDGLPLAVHIDQYLVSHREILNAVISSDADRAGDLMRQHIKNIAKNLTNNTRSPFIY